MFVLDLICMAVKYEIYGVLCVEYFIYSYKDYGYIHI